MWATFATALKVTSGGARLVGPLNRVRDVFRSKVARCSRVTMFMASDPANPTLVESPTPDVASTLKLLCFGASTSTTRLAAVTLVMPAIVARSGRLTTPIAMPTPTPVLPFWVKEPSAVTTLISTDDAVRRAAPSLASITASLKTAVVAPILVPTATAPPTVILPWLVAVSCFARVFSPWVWPALATAPPGADFAVVVIVRSDSADTVTEVPRTVAPVTVAPATVAFVSPEIADTATAAPAARGTAASAIVADTSLLEAIRVAAPAVAVRLAAPPIDSVAPLAKVVVATAASANGVVADDPGLAEASMSVSDFALTFSALVAVIREVPLIVTSGAAPPASTTSFTVFAVALADSLACTSAVMSTDLPCSTDVPPIAIFALEKLVTTAPLTPAIGMPVSLTVTTDFASSTNASVAVRRALVSVMALSALARMPVPCIAPPDRVAVDCKVRFFADRSVAAVPVILSSDARVRSPLNPALAPIVRSALVCSFNP